MCGGGKLGSQGWQCFGSRIPEWTVAGDCFFLWLYRRKPRRHYGTSGCEEGIWNDDLRDGVGLLGEMDFI